MPRKLNENISADIRRKTEGTKGFVAINYQGLNSSESYDLRKSLREVGIRMRVVQNRLAAMVLEKSLQHAGKGSNGGKSPFGDLFRGPTALVLGDNRGEDEIILASRVLVQWRKKHKDKLTIKGGYLSGRLLRTEDVVGLSRCPDRKTLYSQVAGLFQAPLRNLATASQQILARVVYALQAVKEKKEKAGGA